MLPVFWTEAADEDLEAITDYVAGHDPAAAVRLWQAIKSSAVNLSEHPYLFKESERMPGYREIVVHPNDLVFYRVLADRVQIEMVAACTHCKGRDRQAPDKARRHESAADPSRRRSSSASPSGRRRIPHPSVRRPRRRAAALSKSV